MHLWHFFYHHNFNCEEKNEEDDDDEAGGDKYEKRATVSTTMAMAMSISVQASVYCFPKHCDNGRLSDACSNTAVRTRPGTGRAPRCVWLAFPARGLRRARAAHGGNWRRGGISKSAGAPPQAGPTRNT